VDTAGEAFRPAKIIRIHSISEFVRDFHGRDIALSGGMTWIRILNHVVGNEAVATVGFSGWGGQAVASGDYAVIPSGRFRVGFIARYYLASPKPSENLGGPGYAQPNDTLQIFAIGPEVTFSFR
jgi:hypothetical protein